MRGSGAAGPLAVTLIYLVASETLRPVPDPETEP